MQHPLFKNLIYGIVHISKCIKINQIYANNFILKVLNLQNLTTNKSKEEC